MIQISTQLSFKDYLHFNYHHFFSRPIVKVLLGIFGFVIAMAILEAVLKAIQGMEYQEESIGDFDGLFLPGVLLLTVILTYFQAKRNFKSAKALHEPITYTFTDDKISLKSNSLDIEIKWEAITKVVETKRVLLFYKSPALAHIIPKASFENDAQLKALRRLIASQKGLKQKLKKS